MAWFRREQTQLPPREEESRVPEGLWVKCNACKEIIYRKEVVQNASVCPKCGFHFRIGARERLALLFDKDTFAEAGLFATSIKPDMRDKSPGDGVVCGFGRIEGRTAGANAADFTTLGSSSAEVHGKKQYWVRETCRKNGIPLVNLMECAGGRIPDIMGAAGIGRAGEGARYTHARETPWASAVLGLTYGGGAFTCINSDFVVMRKGAVLAVSSQIVDALDAVDAIRRHLRIPVGDRASRLDAPRGARRAVRLRAADTSRELVPAELLWLPIGRSLRLAWKLQIHTLDGRHVYETVVDATRGLDPSDPSRVLARFDLVSDAGYLVYPRPAESPNHVSPLPPADARTLVADPFDALASPLGWHGTGLQTFSTHRGNNVHAYDDRNADNLPPAAEPTCPRTRP